MPAASSRIACAAPSGARLIQLGNLALCRTSAGECAPGRASGEQHLHVARAPHPWLHCSLLRRPRIAGELRRGDVERIGIVWNPAGGQAGHCCRSLQHYPRRNSPRPARGGGVENSHSSIPVAAHAEGRFSPIHPAQRASRGWIFRNHWVRRRRSDRPPDHQDRSGSTKLLKPFSRSRVKACARSLAAVCFALERQSYPRPAPRRSNLGGPTGYGFESFAFNPKICKSVPKTGGGKSRKSQRISPLGRRG